MKTITLVRHAKSSWKQPELSDLERPLNKRGKHDAPTMGKRLAKRGARPDHIISSPAKRALATARIIVGELGREESEIEVDERFYHATASELADVISCLDNRWNQVMIFGHNPELTELVNRFSSEYVENVPTCGVVELTFEVGGWEELAGPIRGRMTMDYPKKE